MFNRDTLTTDFTDGVIREVKYGPCQGTDSKVDLGYLVAHINVRKFTRGSFYVNRWAFTELKLREFLDALGSCGLGIQVHKPLGLVFYNENDIKKEERRIAETELTAIYR